MRNIIILGFLLILTGCASSSFHSFELRTNSTVNIFNVFDKFYVETESPKGGVNTGVRVSDVFHIEKGRELVWVFNEAYGKPRMGMTFSDARMRINVVRKDNLSIVFESPINEFIKLMQDDYAKEYPDHSLNLQEKKLGKYVFALHDGNIKEYQTVNSYYMLLDSKHFIGIHFEYIGKDKDLSEYKRTKLIEETIVSSLNIKAI